MSRKAKKCGEKGKRTHIAQKQMRDWVRNKIKGAKG